MSVFQLSLDVPRDRLLTMQHNLNVILSLYSVTQTVNVFVGSVSDRSECRSLLVFYDTTCQRLWPRRVIMSTQTACLIVAHTTTICGSHNKHVTQTSVRLVTIFLLPYSVEYTCITYTGNYFEMLVNKQ